ncbi:hypothetical protein HTZ77_20980 [Nonomuraea sp. SMC257]|uniref:Uncharacterized protein n=1 Tax=Nonomuraea montanisoli TaxID=2741721 RepID=A0A7Y6M449_9ACTN|nr:hypothetical protein [Nonomuraea montanisoli]NUW33887.1 hypothetical protein [Nonomuraea montanisoli]
MGIGSFGQRARGTGAVSLLVFARAAGIVWVVVRRSKGVPAPLALTTAAYLAVAAATVSPARRAARPPRWPPAALAARRAARLLCCPPAVLGGRRGADGRGVPQAGRPRVAWTLWGVRSVRWAWAAWTS